MSEVPERQPNIFTYATKELSQDAVICWLIEWAYHGKPGDKGLRECGQKFLKALFKKHGREVPENVSNVEIWQQDENIDALARIGEYVLLIEDKTGTKPHGDQLTRYYESVRKGETQAGTVDKDKILPIYLKTGNQSLRSRIEIENEIKSKLYGHIPYKVFNRSDFLSVIEEYRGAHSLLADFADYLEDWNEYTQGFKQWEEKGKYGWWSWQGFFRALEENHLVVFNKENRVGFGSSGKNETSSLKDNLNRYRSGNAPWGWEWNWVNNASGGFAGFWWWWKPLERGGNTFTLYLQLEISLHNTDARKLCFKLGDSDNDVRKEIGHYCKDRILEASSGRVCKPNRMRTGGSMTIAQWDESKTPWLVFNSGGGVNIEKTVENLMAAQEILDKAAEAIRKEQGAA